MPILDDCGARPRDAPSRARNQLLQPRAIQPDDGCDISPVEPLDGYGHQGSALADVERAERGERGGVHVELIERSSASPRKRGSATCPMAGLADDAPPEPGGRALGVAELGRVVGACRQGIRRKTRRLRLIAQGDQQREAVQTRTVELAERRTQPLGQDRAGGRGAVR